MAAALLRGGSGLCVRCIHRELCRLVWRPQTALFSSKPPDRKPARRTHIKKAKPEPRLDVAKLLDQLFSQRRPGAMPPAGKARLATKPPTASSMKVFPSDVPPLSKTKPATSAVTFSSGFNQSDNVPEKTTSTSAPQTNQKTSYSSETPKQTPHDFTQVFAADSVPNVTVPPTSITSASSGPQAAAAEPQTMAETIETDIETATEPVELTTATELPASDHTSPFSAATVEPLLETTTESAVEPDLSPVETLQVVESPVEPTINAATEAAPTKDTDSGVLDVSQRIKEELLIETTVETPAEAISVPMETLENRAVVVEGPIEPVIDITLDTAAETTSTGSGVVDMSHTTSAEPSLETRIEPAIEVSSSPLGTIQVRVAEGSVETEAEQMGVVNISYSTDKELLIETIIEPAVEVSRAAEGLVGTQQSTEAQAEQMNSSTDLGEVNVSHAAEEEPLIAAALESRAVVSEGKIEPAVENESAEILSQTEFIQNAQDSAPLPLSNTVESTIEAPVETSSGDPLVEEGVNKSEHMTLESVTLDVVKAQVESLKADELLQTQSVLDEKAEKQLQELLVQTASGAEHEAAAETENSAQDESEVLTEALSKWDSLSEDLDELEGESGTLVKELLCHVPAAASKSASEPAAGPDRESLQSEEKGSEAEAMTLESVTLAQVEEGIGSLETEVLLETRNALEKEAEALATEEKMEVETAVEDTAAVFEDTTEAELLTLDSISEATDAIEAETSVVLEAMFGSEQGPKHPPSTSLAEQDLGRQHGAETESREQEGSVLEAMTLESVTLAEVEASLGALQNESLSETAEYLEKEAEILSGERRTETEAEVVSEETSETLTVELLPDVDALSEALQTDTLMEELLFSVPGHPTAAREAPTTSQEAANTSDETVVSGSGDGDTAAAAASSAEEEAAQTETFGGEGGEGARSDLDPVQKLFLEKIREYNDMRRLNGVLLEAEPGYKKHLSEETAKLQRLYGGGDLSSFPQFTFDEPDMDQDSK